MGYSNYKKISQVTNKFGLEHRLVDLFKGEKIMSVKPSYWLKTTLQKALFVPLNTVKAKSEFLISPILVEVASSYLEKITLFSGEELNLDTPNDLSEPCDFIFSLQPPKLEIDQPIMSLAVAQKENMNWGISQCSAQMYAAFLFNECKDKPMKTIFGCASTGVEWKFIKFENNTFYIDRQSHTDIKDVLGVWHHIIKSYLKP